MKVHYSCTSATYLYKTNIKINNVIIVGFGKSNRFLKK